MGWKVLPSNFDFVLLDRQVHMDRVVRLGVSLGLLTCLSVHIPDARLLEQDQYTVLD